MRAKILICAENIIIDQTTNNVSIINLFEQINPPALPIILPRMTILSIVEREESDSEVIPFVIRISSGNQVVFEQTNEYNFQNLQRSRNILLFGGMPITQPGILLFEILVNNSVFQTYKIIVTTPPVPNPVPPPVQAP